MAEFISDDKMLKELNKYYKIASNGKTFNINNFLFLINDSSLELHQHFTNTHVNDTSYNNIINVLNYKNDFCRKLDSTYIFGINPDKSFCLKNIIKSDNSSLVENRYFVDVFKKNIIKYNFKIVDFYDVFDGLNNVEDFFYKSDSHINKEGSLLYVNYLIKFLKINNNLKNDLIETVNNNYWGDLTSDKNYNISNIDKSTFVETTKNLYVDSKQFEFVNLPLTYTNTYERNNIYVRNNSSTNNLKVIFLCDSTIFNDWTMYAYNFLETIFIWDHLYFPTELIDKIRPNYVIELRTERFLYSYSLGLYENYVQQIYNNNYNSEINIIPDNIVINYYNVYYNHYAADECNNLELNSNLEYIRRYLSFVEVNIIEKLKEFNQTLPYNFDHIEYANLNQDLYNIYGYNKTKLIRHYILHTSKENIKYES